MKKLLKTIAITAMLALSLTASAGVANAKDGPHGRETAWTDPGDPVSDWIDVSQDLLQGVTWEILDPLDDGVTWEE